MGLFLKVNNMNFPNTFICATREISTLDRHIPAPYFRKSFVSDCEAEAHIIISACGFYELYINGRNITKGALAPYISNPDHIVYYDEYDVTLREGENVIGVLLGNGFQNNPGGYIWDFDKAVFRSSPHFALGIKWLGADGSEQYIETDESFVTHPSPIIFDDYRFGEHYDANLKIKGWNEPLFDASDWQNAIIAPNVRGEKRICEAEPVVVTDEIKPVCIECEDDGFRYDFGVNTSGVVRLKINGRKGQKVEMIHVERLVDNKISFDGLWFYRNEEQYSHDLEIIHRDVYICKGEGEEIYTPRFTYHGFRYVLVKGIDATQATDDLLTYVVMNSDIENAGDFSCSNEIANKLQEMTRRSDLANFWYFPTDCPQREKNGWTADAALSAEHMLLNFRPEKSYREWMRNILKAQNDEGMIPGIVPTHTWGYGKGFGPAWDCILAYLPYFVYIYRGETAMIYESAGAILKYLHFLTTKFNEDGLIKFGLGDWCPVGKDNNKFDAPLELTCTIMAMDIAEKSAFMFDAVSMIPEREYAKALAEDFKARIREKLIDFSTMTAAGACQTSQAMAIFYGVFNEDEKKKAFARLLEFIDADGGSMNTGVLGGRVIFHVLAQFGYAEKAFRMIVGPEYPSYGDLILRGATALWEQFNSDVSKVSSMNHHFWGDISHWFIRHLAGLNLNPTGRNVNEVNIAPNFIPSLDDAKAFHIAPMGRIDVRWERNDNGIELEISIPDGMTGKITLPEGYKFSDGENEKNLTSGKFNITA